MGDHGHPCGNCPGSSQCRNCKLTDKPGRDFASLCQVCNPTHPTIDFDEDSAA